MKDKDKKKQSASAPAPAPAAPAAPVKPLQGSLLPDAPAVEPRKPGRQSGRTVFSISDIEKKAGVAHVVEKGPPMVSLPSSTRIPEDVAVALVKYSDQSGLSYAVIVTNALKLHLPRELFELPVAPAAGDSAAATPIQQGGA